MKTDGRKPATVNVVILSVLFVFLTQLLVLDYFQDDAYIAFQYARNLTQDGSLYYNRGETGPFGYTNPLYIAILAAIRLLSLKLLSFEAISRMIAYGSLGTVIFVILRGLSHFVADTGRVKTWFCTTLTLSVLLMFPFFFPNLYSGGETALLTLCLFVLFYSFFWPIRRAYLYVSLAVALTLRMDSLAVLLPLVALVSMDVIRTAKWRGLTRLAVVFSFVVLLFLVQYAITDTFIPLSYGHKSQGFSALTFLSYGRFFVICLAPLLIYLFGKVNIRQLVLVIFHAAYVSFFYSFFMRSHFERYVFPHVFSLFAVLLICAFQKRGAFSGRFVPILFAYAAMTFLPGAAQGYSWVSGYRVSMIHQCRVATALTSANLDEEYRIFASYDAGYVPYHTDWKIVDLYGLTTPDVIERDIRAVLSRRNPTVLIVSLGEYVDDPTSIRLPSKYLQRPATIPPNYDFVKFLPLTNKYWWDRRQYSYYVFVNENATEKLVNDLGEISVDVEAEMGYQKSVFYALDSLARLVTF